MGSFSVRRYRLERRLSQEKLAEEWGWSRGYVSELERGCRNPSLRTVEYIAALMGIPPLELLAA